MIVSPTQLKAARQCRTLWWMQWPEGHQVPKTPALLEGGKLHTEVESYLLTGRIPTSSAAVALLSYLPTPPVPPEQVEVAFTAFGMTCRIDLIEYEPELRITDHKFMSSWHLNEQSCERLKRDPQALVNTLFVTQDQPLVFRWLVVNKRTLECRPRQIHYEPGEALDLYERYWADIEVEMRYLATVRDPLQIPKNGAVPDERGYRRCQKHYGGKCPFFDHCLAWGVDVLGPMSRIVRNAR